MGMIDKELLMTHVVEERKLRFEEFVKEQSASGGGKIKDAVLCSKGHRDFYGKLTFQRGVIHKALWVIPGDKLGDILIYKDRAMAEGYAKALLPLLKNNGFGGSKVWVERIAIRNEASNPLSGLMSPKVTYDDEDKYIIRMIVR